MKFVNIFCCFFLYCFFSVSCGTSVQSVKSFDDDSVIAIMVSRNFPWMTNEGKLLSYEQENASIFFKNDLILYKIPYVHKIYKLSDSAIYEVDKVEERIKYFVFRRGNSTGYLTDSSLNIHLLQCPTDSMFDQLWPTQPFLEPVLENFYYKLIDSLTYRNNDSYHNTYNFQNKTDSSQKGIFTLEFSRSFPFVDYSICRRLDTLKGMKLTNVQVLNKARYIKDYNITVDAVDDYQRLTLLKKINISEIAPFFEFMQRQKVKE